MPWCLSVTLGDSRKVSIAKPKTAALQSTQPEGGAAGAADGAVVTQDMQSGHPLVVSCLQMLQINLELSFAILKAAGITDEQFWEKGPDSVPSFTVLFVPVILAATLAFPIFGVESPFYGVVTRNHIGQLLCLSYSGHSTNYSGRAALTPFILVALSLVSHRESAPASHSLAQAYDHVRLWGAIQTQTMALGVWGDKVGFLTVRIGSQIFCKWKEDQEVEGQEENPQAGALVALKKPATGTAEQARRDPLAPSEPSAQHTSNLLGDGDQQGSKHPDNTQQPEDTQQLPAGACSSTYVDGRVNYEKLLWLLHSAASDDLQQSSAVADSNRREAQGLSDLSQSVPLWPLDNDQSLLEILKMVLQPASCHLNIENLNLNFRREDRSFSGCLPPPKVRAICGKHGLYLTLSLLETLLNHQDLGYEDEIKLGEMVRDQCSLEMMCNDQFSTSKKTVLEVFIKLACKKTPEEELQPKNPPAEASALENPLSLLMIQPVSQPLVSSAMKKGSGEHEEAWIDRFRKLENALYLCDLSNTGNLEKERARRLIHNYSLIYNLSLSSQKIDQAFRRFRSGGNLLLEPALQCLKEL
ncbi:hypothetical protein GW7_01499 [Heterocephalus glaber]|uniref:Uncharacterized protein n=1 Tax=Heterocephalus glaber TaxID=10181 RepID=G5BSM4_HETGA|nr:hypothetical protein GW7_01499 [Heterocephalus glaber]